MVGSRPMNVSTAPPLSFASVTEGAVTATVAWLPREDQLIVTRGEANEKKNFSEGDKEKDIETTAWSGDATRSKLVCSCRIRTAEFCFHSPAAGMVRGRVR